MSTVAPASAIEPLDGRGSAVRFETQCVVIPDPTHHPRRPRVVTKSYALPLWKRRALSAGPSTSALPEDVSFDESQSQLVLRVPLPTFSRKPTLTTRAVDQTPLPPCLVHRPPPSDSPASSLGRPARLLRKTSLSPPPPDVVTVPLRPCCAACQSVTEAALIDGDAWHERFSRAASRRRSASVGGSPRTITVAGSAASASYGTLGVAISVDEIDKRRRVSDSGLSTPLQPKHAHEYMVPLVPHRTTILTTSAADARSPSPSRIPPVTPRIPEEEDDEDESELFPLPSPKRTPTASPAPSAAGSVTSLVVQSHQNPGLSPTPSTNSSDSATAPPLRKPHFLAPPPCSSSSSSLSLPRLLGSTTDLVTVPDDPPRAPSPSVLSALPPLSARGRTQSPSPRLSLRLPSPSPLGMDDNRAGAAPATAPIPIPIPPGPGLLRHTPSLVRLPWRTKRSTSADAVWPSSPPSSPPPLPRRLTPGSPPLSTALSSPPAISPSTSAQKRSFGMSSPLQLFADVLRGVGSLGSGGLASGV